MLKKFVAIFIVFNFFLINTKIIIKADDLPENIFYINNFADLENLATTVNGGNNCGEKYFLLTSNIDINNELWTPIGNKKTNSFLGTFDGNGFEILNLRIENSSANSQGLFGYNSGTVKNVKISGQITDDNNIGGIVGYNLGTIENCQSNVKINASGSNIGGIVGHNKSGIVQNCQNIAEISGNQIIGGIVGCNDEGAVIQNCYNLGSVSGNIKCGGCAGVNNSDIKNSYNIGDVICNGDKVGAFVGDSNNQSPVQNCYYMNDNISDTYATSKTSEQFASGEVAWLLQNDEDSPWGQELNNQQTPYPILDASKKVYKIIFKDGDNEIKTCYSNSDNNITFPDINDSTFAGWVDDNNIEFKKETPITKDFTLHILRKEFFTITFDTNGGKCDIEFAQTNSDGKLNSLPVAKFNSYKFLGWYTEKNGGKKITLETIFDKDITVYAKWIRKITSDIVDSDEEEINESNSNEKNDENEENNSDDNNKTDSDKEVSELPCKICRPETVAVQINTDGTHKIIYRSVAKNGKIYIPPNDPTKIEIINNKKDFIDVPQNHWAYDAITFVSAHELFDDNLSNIFEPSKPINFKTLIGILEKLNNEKNFYAELTSIFNYANQQFFLDYNVTREQLIFIIHKYFVSAQNFDDKLNFSDINQVSFYALNSLHWAVKNNIVNGSANLFYPKNFATKAETAKIFHNLMLNLFYKES